MCVNRCLQSIISLPEFALYLGVCFNIKANDNLKSATTSHEFSISRSLTVCRGRLFELFASFSLKEFIDYEVLDYLIEEHHLDL